MRAHGALPANLPRKFFRAMMAAVLVLVCAATSNAISEVKPLNASYDAGLKASRAGKYKQAAKLFQRAAREGVQDAFYMLGVLHQTGIGVTKSYRDALILYRHVAVMGHARAQAKMAQLIADGNGTPADPVTGYMWYEISVQLGNSHAISERLKLAVRMKKSDIALARKRAAACLESKYRTC
jgi:TPR repeat protein